MLPAISNLALINRPAGAHCAEGACRRSPFPPYWIGKRPSRSSYWESGRVAEAASTVSLRGGSFHDLTPCGQLHPRLLVTNELFLIAEKRKLS